MNIEEKAAQIVAAAEVVTVASIDENGYPRPVAMVKLKDKNGGIYFSTGTSTAKVAHFKANSKAGISIVEGENSVVYTGEMEIVTDQGVKESLWDDWMLPHIPGGVTNPQYCVLKFTPKSSTYWIDNVFVKDGKYLNLFCQSCGMPMQAAGDFGTETDGSPSGEYCVYCYKGGTFTAACTMEEMIRHCAQFHEEFRDENGKSYTFEESVTLMREYFPTLKRWKKD